MVRRAWGLTMLMPMVPDRPANCSGVMAGMLLTSEALDEHWARLDELEGDHYERVTVEVTADGSTLLSAQTYVLRRGGTGANAAASRPDS